MTRPVAARVLLTFVLLGSTILSFLLDWRSNHLLNPEWPPHARFHDALLLFTLAGMSLTGVWLLWRRSKEPEVAFIVASSLCLSYSVPPFYITSILPGSSLWAGKPGAIPHIADHLFYPNLAVAGLDVLLTVTAFWLSWQRAASSTAYRPEGSEI